MNLGQLRAAVKLRLRLPVAGDPFLPDATIDACIAAALRDLSTEHDWPWMNSSATVTFSTTTGKAGLPAGFIKARELLVGDTSPRRARRVGLAEFLDNRDGFVWTEQVGANQVALSPVPLTVPTATLYFVVAEPALSVDADAPLAPAVYHTILVARASYHGNVRRRNDPDAAVDSNEWTEGIKMMKKASSAHTGPRQIRSAFRVESFATW